MGDTLVAQVLRIGGGSQWFFAAVGAFLFRRHLLLCDQTVDVGLNLHRYVTSICSEHFIPKYDALQQFVSRVNRIAVDQEVQPHMTVDMNLVEDTLEELFSARVEADCEAQRIAETLTVRESSSQSKQGTNKRPRWISLVAMDREAERQRPSSLLDS